MQLFYEGTDITGYIDIDSCIHRDVSGGRADGLEMTLEHAERWFAWGPRKGDKIIAAYNGYDTGTLYIDMILPENGRFRLTASSAPPAARNKAWKTFENTTPLGLLRACAAECEAGYAAYGIDENAEIPFALRKNEGCAAFLERATRLEGATLKCLNGKFTAIGILYAQALAARQNITIRSNTPGVVYRKIDSRKLKCVNVIHLHASGSAVDTAVTTTDSRTYTDQPAPDDVTAGKWARALLLQNNRMAEELTIPMQFNAGMSAMTRVDVTSATELGGEWIVDEARHDLKNGRTTATLLRCVTTVI